MDLRGAVRGATIGEQEQTTGNLAIITAVFASSAALVNNTVVIEDRVGSLLYFQLRVDSYMTMILTLLTSDSAEPSQYIGESPTVECGCTTSKCLKVSTNLQNHNYYYY